MQMLDVERDATFFKNRPFTSEKKTSLVPQQTDIANTVFSSVLLGETEQVTQLLNFISSSPLITSDRDRRTLFRTTAEISLIAHMLKDAPTVGLATQPTPFTFDAFKNYIIVADTLAKKEYMRKAGMLPVDKKLDQIREEGIRVVVEFPKIVWDEAGETVIAERTKGLIAEFSHS